MARLRDSPDDLFALVGRTAREIGYPPEFVEKDFWVTEVLRSVARPIENAHVVFKGGTSLSKGYELLERFSEDVDILVVPSRKSGKGSVDRVLKALCSRAGRDMGIGEGGLSLEGSSRGVHRSMRFRYPARTGPTPLMPGVLLELGVRGTPDPCERKAIRSLLGRHAVRSMGEPETAFEEFLPLEILVLHPVRTLFEKLAALHHLASTFPDSGTGLRRGARHLYDVHRLLSDEGVRDALGRSPILAERTAADIQTVSREWGWPQTPRPVGGFADSPAFDPKHPSQATLVAGYEDLRTLIVGTVPTIEDCRDAVRKSASLL